jgi:predicted O-methyltransferase YrrM
MPYLKALQTISIKHADSPLLISTSLVSAALFLSLHMAGLELVMAIGFFLLSVLVTATSVHTYRWMDARLHEQQRQIQAIVELAGSLSPRVPFPSMTGWAASPELMAQIFHQIELTRPKTVFELGSGVSTVMIPHMLHQVGGGILHSVEHDTEHVGRTRHHMTLQGIGDAQLHEAPLVPVDLNNERYLWYDLTAIPMPESIDMLIVDGPPLKSHALARYPALPMLWERLSDGAVILMDDTDRADETQILKRWAAEYPVDVAWTHPTSKGFTVMRVRKQAG